MSPGSSGIDRLLRRPGRGGPHGVAPRTGSAEAARAERAPQAASASSMSADSPSGLSFGA